MTDREPGTESFERLMRAAQEGDSAAYAELLRAVLPRIRHTVSRARGFAGRAEVDDIVQDVLLSLHAMRATYDPARPFLPWLNAIVHNRLADAARRHARISRREVPLDDVTFAEPPTNGDSDEEGDAAALHAAVRGLPEGQRRAIQLLKLEERSLKEAAALSGSSVGALKLATHRALATLRRTLGTNRG